MKWIALAVLVSTAACVPKDGPLMEAGENCQGCHGGSGPLYLGERRREGVTWTVAGTVFEASNPAVSVEGAQVQITDATGFSFSLRSNLAGNFYTRETVSLPLQACIQNNGHKTCQQSPVTSGSCNSCHNLSVFNAPEPPLVTP